MYSSLPKEKPSSCLDYYSLLQAKWETQPTSVQSWSKHYPLFANKWKILFNISKMSADNKLRQFSFKLLHRILVTKKELKRCKIKPDDECSFAKVRIPLNTHSWLGLSPKTFTTKWWHGLTTNRNPKLVWVSSRSRRITTFTEAEIWNFHNTNEKVYLWL